MRDGLGVLERGVSARAPHAGPQQLGLLRAAAEGDTHLPYISLLDSIEGMSD